jgi:3-hydroxyisobutyrate dehydrogenase-like beta-hydroxyacid dehydrogenase
MKIAFLGLGNMGSGMARCLLRAGHSLRVWNRRSDKMAPLAGEGAVACGSPAEAIESADLVISCLMDDASVHAVFDGADGLIAKMKSKQIHLCVTTVSPVCGDWLAEAHAAGGSRYVSGPVLGRPDAAAEGSLLQFLAGDASAIEEIGPVCKAFAPVGIPMAGPASVANSQKLCANLFIASLIEMMAECYTFAEKSGASREIMGQIFERSLALPGLKGYARRMKEREFEGEGGFSTRGGLKDVRLMLDAGKRVGCPLDIATVLEGKLTECLDRGLADSDWSAVQEVTRARAGLAAKQGPLPTGGD